MAKPKLALIPAAQGTKLYSVLPSDGSGDFTFNRGSVATRINAQGLIENVASGQSRLDYPLIDGVQKGCPHHILEPARTNLLPYSNDFSNSSWSKYSFGTGLTPVLTSNSLISPDGTLNASKVVFNSGSGTTTSDQSILEDTVTATSGVAINQSVYLKGEIGGEKILVRGANGSSYTTLTLTDKWVRYNVTETSGATSSTWAIGLRQGLGGVVINSTVTIKVCSSSHLRSLDSNILHSTLFIY